MTTLVLVTNGLKLGSSAAWNLPTKFYDNCTAKLDYFTEADGFQTANGLTLWNFIAGKMVGIFETWSRKKSKLSAALRGKGGEFEGTSALGAGAGEFETAEIKN